MVEEKYVIPMDVQEQLVNRVMNFNKNELAKNPCKYCVEVRGKFIYLVRRTIDGSFEKIGRLTYNGDIENMDFAIFRYSIEKYDAACDYFDGIEQIDGTIEGAMRAGLEAYPIGNIEFEIEQLNCFLKFISNIKIKERQKSHNSD